MNQEIKYIPLSELVLWTENPRDPIDPNATNQSVVDRAIDDSKNKWSLQKLAKEMGDYYDFSELPTVVILDKKPVVYDGNRRIVLGMIKHGLVSVGDKDFDIPSFPEVIPCNVCSEDVALTNVFRKHAKSGSWLPLERDIFLSKHLKKEKSDFLQFEEATGLISSNPHLNQGFVKKEILKSEILQKLGLELKNGSLYSKHSDSETQELLRDLSEKIENKTISTRNNRGKVLETLDASTQYFIENNKKNNFSKSSPSKPKPNEDQAKPKKKTQRTNKSPNVIFGKTLELKKSFVSDLYRDLTDLDTFYNNNSDRLSKCFPGYIRMCLRFLVEAAAADNDISLSDYVNRHFEDARNSLTGDEKTTLRTQFLHSKEEQRLTSDKFLTLLQIGAHAYKTSFSYDEAIALSIIVGACLSQSHGKQISE